MTLAQGPTFIQEMGGGPPQAMLRGSWRSRFRKCRACRRGSGSPHSVPVAVHPELNVIPSVVRPDGFPTDRETMTFWAWVPASVTYDPISVVIRLERPSGTVGTMTLERIQLDRLRQLPPRFSGIDAELWLPHQVTIPRDLGVERIAYELTVETGGSRRRRNLRRDIPVARPQVRADLLFPLLGPFSIARGHASEGDHLERSQTFAFDILPLGPGYAVLASGDGSENTHFAGFGREVRAPQAGYIVRAQDDIPDNPSPGTLIDLDARPEGMWASLGNGVVIEHDEAAFSVLGHLQAGSLRVEEGMHIEAGDLIGLVGNSGHSSGPHLHFHLMNGPTVFRSDGLPVRFSGLDDPTPRRGAIDDSS